MQPKHTGSVTRNFLVYNQLSTDGLWYRAVATSIANWAEEQGGIPLFTIEGDRAWQLSPSTL